MGRRVKEALHRRSLFGKIAEVAGRRMKAFDERYVQAGKEARARRKSLQAEKAQNAPRKWIEGTEQQLGLAEQRAHLMLRKRSFWQRRYAWAAERHEQWGVTLRRRRIAFRRWLRIHRTFGAGGFAPSSFWVRQRVDQGQDIEIGLGRRLRAPGNGEVVGWAHDGPFPSGFGDPYAIIRVDTGPFAGLTLYLGHANQAVPPVGTRFKEGDKLSRCNNSLNAGRGWAEIGPWPVEPWDGHTQPAPGQKIAHLFTEVRG